MNNIFEKANRIKLRFLSRQGSLTVEDLFDLSLTSLDTLARAVNKELKSEEEESFIPNKKVRPKTTNNALRLEILKHIIAAKVDEEDAAKLKAEKAARLSQLKELAANKATEAFAAQSLEDIQRQIAELESSE